MHSIQDLFLSNQRIFSKYQIPLSNILAKVQFWRIIFEHIIQIAIFFYLQYIWKQCVCVPIFCLQIYYEKERLTSPISKIFGTRLKCVLVVDRETKLQLITNYQKLFDGKLGFAFLFQITFTRGHNFTKYYRPRR